MAYVANVKVLPQNALSLSGSHIEISGSTHLSGNLTVNGEITAEKLIVNETVQDRTVIYSSGSVKIGDEASGIGEDKHQISGSLYMTGSEVKFSVPSGNSLQLNGGHFVGDGRGLTDLSSSNLVHTGDGAKLLISKTDGTFALNSLGGGAGVSFSENAENGTVTINVAATGIGALTKVGGNNLSGTQAYDAEGNAVNDIINSGSIRLHGQALSLHQLATDGLIVRHNGAALARSVEVSGGANEGNVVQVVNGDGVAGNIAIAVHATSGSAANTLVVRDPNGDFEARNVELTELTASAATITNLTATNLTFTNVSATSVDADSLTGSMALDVSTSESYLKGADAAGQLLIGNATSGKFELNTLDVNGQASQNSNIVLTNGNGTVDISLGLNLQGLTTVTASHLTASASVKSAQLTASSGLVTTLNSDLINVSGINAKVTGSAMIVDGSQLSGSSVLAREKLDAQGAVYLKIRTVNSSSDSGSPTASGTDYMLDCDASAPSGGAFTLALPSASGMTGRTFVIKKSDSSENPVTISGGNIDGNAQFILNGPYQSINVTSNGGKWLVH